MSTTLQDLVNRAVFYSTEMQSHFGRLIAEADWDVDFSADPQLTFTSGEGTVLQAIPHLLGSESKTPGTWLWGWENINGFPEPVVATAHEVRKFGAGEGVAELTTAELDLDEELALRLTLAAKEATGKWAHYPAAAGAGTTVWLLVDAPDLVLPDPQVKTSVRALMQGLTQTTVTDHRAAVAAYAQKRGIPTVDLPQDGLRLLFADGAADLSFDAERRISNCEMQQPLEGEAADQFAQATTGGSTSVPAARGSAAAEEKSEPAPAVSTADGAPADDGSVGTEVDAAESTEAAADSSTAAPSGPDSPAEAAAPDDAADRSTDATTRDSGDAPGTAVREEAKEPEQQEPKKKKGLFSKLFGR